MLGLPLARTTAVKARRFEPGRGSTRSRIRARVRLLAIDALGEARRILDRREARRRSPFGTSRTAPPRRGERRRRADESAEHERAQSAVSRLAVHATIVGAIC